LTVAVDKEKAVLGKSVGSRSKEEGERAAVMDCEAQGGTDCKVKGSSKNACVAMIVGDSRLVTSGGFTKDEAESVGLETCRNTPDTNCGVYYSGCVEAVLE
jgi:hypothetical protein